MSNKELMDVVWGLILALCMFIMCFMLLGLGAV